MNSIMDRIEVQLLRTLRKVYLTSRSAVLCSDTYSEVLLCRRGNDLAEKLRKLRCVLSLFKRSGLIVLTDLRVSLTVSRSGHRKIHTNLCALALEVCAEVFLDILANITCNTDHMLCSPGHLLFLLYELIRRRMAYRTLLWWNLSLINIATYGTYPSLYLHNSFSF